MNVEVAPSLRKHTADNLAAWPNLTNTFTLLTTSNTVLLSYNFCKLPQSARYQNLHENGFTFWVSRYKGLSKNPLRWTYPFNGYCHNLKTLTFSCFHRPILHGTLFATKSIKILVYHGRSWKVSNFRNLIVELDKKGALIFHSD